MPDRVQLGAERDRISGRTGITRAIPQQSATPGEEADTFVSDTQIGTARADADRAADRAGSRSSAHNRSILPSFSVAKYGAQCDVDPYDPDAGDGFMPDCSTPITGNDPHDSYIKDSTALEQKWIKHLVQTWGKSNKPAACPTT